MSDETYTVRFFPRWHWYWPIEIRQGDAVRAVGDIPAWFAIQTLAQMRHRKMRISRSVRHGQQH